MSQCIRCIFVKKLKKKAKKTQIPSPPKTKKTKTHNKCRIMFSVWGQNLLSSWNDIMSWGRRFKIINLVLPFSRIQFSNSHLFSNSLQVTPEHKKQSFLLLNRQKPNKPGSTPHFSHSQTILSSFSSKPTNKKPHKLQDTTIKYVTWQDISRCFHRWQRLVTVFRVDYFGWTFGPETPK